ncbi:MAG TPA: hypothetical protein PKN13_07305 [Accumulibacter sp.]|nr:hypothetical protein [Accumulibacter sp.]HMW16876.1 hypothetical protein [Accumulibacter sp.]HNC17323.1 hypothetical protein [Accumulibacter sp.]HND79821.1 hypothetical protein [Accumulibacter sp.]HNE13298.1 hypothetical protein [Accumulibacter sp.]
MRTEKISDLAVSHFVTVPSRGGTAHSVVSIYIDGQHIPELPIAVATKPNSGQNVIVAFRGEAITDIVGWLDPVTNTPIVVIPKIVSYYPIILIFLFPILSILLITAYLSHRDIWFYLVITLVVALVLIQAIGWPGVARHLKKAQAQNEEKHRQRLTS